MTARRPRQNKLLGLPMLTGARFNQDATRYCAPSAEGIACYRGSLEGGQEWHGQLVGIARSEDEADRFLEGAYVQLASRSDLGNPDDEGPRD